MQFLFVQILKPEHYTVPYNYHEHSYIKQTYNSTYFLSEHIYEQIVCMNTHLFSTHTFNLTILRTFCLLYIFILFKYIFTVKNETLRQKK
jgi:hypothetical protein